MAKRLCKCKACGNSLTTDKAYRVTKGKINLYYCNEQEWLDIQEEQTQKIQCFEVIKNLLGVQMIAPSMIKQINQLRQFYSYIVIERTFKQNEKNIRWFLENKASENEFGNMKYIMTIVSNNIEKEYKNYKKELIELENLFNSNKNNDLEVDIINTELIDVVRNDVSDISNFLD